MGKYGYFSSGQALLSKALIQLPADEFSLPVSCLASGNPALGSMGSMTRLMATSKRAYAKEDLPGLLLLVPPILW